MDDKKLYAGKALNDDELDSVAGGVHDEDIFRDTARIACKNCKGSFDYIVWARDTVIDTPCPLCGARVFIEL